jgi:hypothetical protein
MHGIVALIGLLLIFAGVLGFYDRQSLVGIAERAVLSRWFYVALAFRLVVGALLIWAGPATRWPGFVQLLGAVTVFAGLAGLAVGQERLGRLLAWWMGGPSWFLHGWMLFAVGLGAALLYAALSV